MSTDVPNQRTETAHFRHANTHRARTGLSNTTRLLAAGTYLDRKFADDVIDELLADEHRAVVPSFFGLDLEPILRHALNAKRIHVLRDAVLSAALVLGLVLATGSTVGWLVIGVYVSFVASQWRDMKATGKMILVGVGVSLCVILFAVFVGGLGGSSTTSTFGATAATSGGHTPGVIVKLLIFPIVVFAVLVGFEWGHYTRLADGFRWGAERDAPNLPNDRIRRRVEEVARAQNGNITVYSNWSPFIGAGRVVRSWSIAVDLMSVNDVTNERVPVPVDAVDLHAAVMERVTALRDQDQPDNERIVGLAVGHHVVAQGTRNADHALVDNFQHPFSVAEPDAIKAIIRHPQGGIRYYQRVTVTADGMSIADQFGDEIAEAEDQEIGASSFLYLAVEGGMLYVEYVGTVMRPIRGAFHVVDALPRTMHAEWIPKVMRAAAVAATDAIAAPLRLIPGLLHNTLLNRRMDRATRDAGEYLVYDYGARRSIRELGSASGYTSYMQELDWQKYSKFVERRMNEAVLDYLAAAGVDAAEYRERVRIVQNTGVMITGNVSGQVVNASTASSITQHTTKAAG